MKISTKGFTLVELMIVIAIIGILAASLFPSLTSYLARGRDTSRISALKEISSWVSAYFIDKSQYATGVVSTTKMCANSWALKAYIPKFPIDPVPLSTKTCGIAGGYWYGTGTVGLIVTISPVFSAALENPSGGNTGSVLDSFQGIVSPNTVGTIDLLTKNSGSGYVIRN